MEGTEVEVGMERGNKLIDLISAATKDAFTASNECIKPFVGLEFFPPRSAQGVELLKDRIKRLKDIYPLFADFTWGAGGSTSDLTLELTIQAKEEFGFEPNMHLTCTNMPVEKIDQALNICQEHGIRNIVALRGDPPAGAHSWEADKRGFSCALDLVVYIRAKYGDYFCLSVAGYPEGHPDRIKVFDGDKALLSESELTRCNISVDTGELFVCSDQDWTEEIQYLKLKCEAGAEVIITQMFFDPMVYGHFVSACRKAGIVAPIIPGIMCISSYAGFKRMTSFCRTRVPPSLLERMEAVQDNETAIKEIGVEYGEAMCRSLLKQGAPGLHFYTLNLEKVPVGILRRLGLAGQYDRPLPPKNNIISESPSVPVESASISTNNESCSIVSPQEVPILSESNGKEEEYDELVKKGRNAILAAISDMPGLMFCGAELRALDSKPLSNAKITVSLRVTAQNAAFIDLLHDLGAEIRWCSSGVLATDDSIVAAVSSNNTAQVFARQGQNVEEYWSNALQALIWPNSDGPNLVIDDGGDLALLMHEGITAEIERLRTGTTPLPEPQHGTDILLLWKILAESLKDSPQRWHKITRRIQGLTVSTTAGAHRILRLEGSGALRVAAINTSDSVTRVLCRGRKGGGRGVRVQNTLVDSLNKLTGVDIKGKSVVVCGFGDIGRACTSAILEAEGFPLITEVDPICAFRAAMGGKKVVTLDQALDDGVEVYLTTTGVRSTISAQDMKRMKDGSIVASVSHLDGEIEVAGLEVCTKREPVDEFVTRYIFDDGRSILVVSEGRLLDLSDVPDINEPGLTASTILSMQAFVLLELWRERSSGRYTRGTVSSVPRLLDESVARLHLPVLNATVTSLTREQSDYMRVPLEGPFKPYAYRYAGYV